MVAVDIPNVSGFHSNQAHPAMPQSQQSIFNRVVLSNTAANNRESAFSVSGQKMVHFKDSGTNVGNSSQLLSQFDERKNQVRSALVKDFNPRKNVSTMVAANGAGGQQRSANCGKIILADSGFKTATAFN